MQIFNILSCGEFDGKSDLFFASGTTLPAFSGPGPDISVPGEEKPHSTNGGTSSEVQ